MENALTLEVTPEEAAELEAAITCMVGQMNEARAHMRSDQAIIEQLKADSHKLKNEIRALQTETRALLTALKATA